MKIDHTPCYILHKHDYKESSLLLEIFSREYGRLSLIAKGAKRNSQRKGVDYSLYQKYKMSWVAKSELGTLTDIEYANEPGYLTPAKLMSGFYLNEITMRLLHKHESHPELFDAYDKTIISLASDISEHIVLRYFEKSLLDSLGYGVVLDSDVETGEKIDAGNQYYYQFDYGPLLNPVNSKDGIKISGKTLLQINNETLSDTECITEAKMLLKSILYRHLGSKPLASRELYQAYVQNKDIV